MNEEAVLFGNTRSLVGIITEPPEAIRCNNLPAIMFLNAGMVHRVGPNRLSVKMARNLAAMGFVGFRFDFSGIGDSPVCSHNIPFEERWVTEAQEAMSYLRAARGIEKFVLIGICSGANSSFKIACGDPRVVGAVLINIQAYQHSDELSSYIINREHARYYWKFAFFNLPSWLKAIKGRVDYGSLIKVLGFQLCSLFVRKGKLLSGANNVVTDLCALTDRGVRLLLIYSRGDPGLDHFQLVLSDKIRELRSDGKVRVEIIPESHHSFTRLSNQKYLLKVVQDWAREIVQPTS